ncbi:L-threonylcarbamoyladenylate synthase [Synechococcus sp. A15-60]|uniref:L-threonylcarbamoyladenylate synthase n=1 Tax=Synechococcus sp. A15-60 TaxID=1050655 RepID=UPI0016474A73|nr:Sua5/YciO/YrdC/YwlC family protein [Synechococcus sp. A15-60]
MTTDALPWMQVQEMALHLRQGGAALVPTDTLPALAAAPDHAAQVWTLKQRPQDKPLILMAADADALLSLTTDEVRLDAEPLAQRYWPGALTLVLPVEGGRYARLNPGMNSLGLRIPDCPTTRELLRASGPLATTSANRSGVPASQNELEASVAFPSLPLLGPLPWPTPSGLASTVIAWMSPGRWHLLRQGAVMANEINGSHSCSG